MSSNQYPSYRQSYIAVAELVITALEEGVETTADGTVAPTLPKMVTDLREFGRDDLADRLEVFVK